MIGLSSPGTALVDRLVRVTVVTQSSPQGVVSLGYLYNSRTQEILGGWSRNTAGDNQHVGLFDAASQTYAMQATPGSQAADVDVRSRRLALVDDSDGAPDCVLTFQLWR